MLDQLFYGVHSVLAKEDIKVNSLSEGVAKLKSNTTRELLQPGKPIGFGVDSVKAVDKVFGGMPKEYRRFLVAENGPQLQYINKQMCDWRSALPLEDNLQVGAVYHKRRPIRYSEIITINKRGQVKIVSVMNFIKNFTPCDGNVVTFNVPIDKDVKRVIHIVHMWDNKGNSLGSSWLLFKRK